ncbi:MAG: TRAP transporter fused permease subunit, partial [Pseudomonadota bacterium]
MGAGAFLISEFTQVPYVEIVLISIFPAILYFGAVYLLVHIGAVKQGLEGLPAEDLPRVRDVLAGGWHFLLPLVILVWLLVSGYSPMRVGFYAILAIMAAAALRATFNFLRDGPTARGVVELAAAGLRLTLQALELGARNAVAVSMACAVAGIIVGVVGLTGLGLKFSAMMLAFSGGNLFLALVLVVIASLILGMGLPVTAAYIVLIILVGPALQTEFGVPLIIAHLVVFWWSQDSNVTPPVALAGFAGAAIAKSGPMETSVQAWKYAKGLYLIPLFMVYNEPIIIGGPLLLVLWNGALAILALTAFAAAIEGHLFVRLPLWQRVLACAGTVAVFWPSVAWEAVGVAAILLVLGLNRMAAPPRDAATSKAARA